MRIETENGHYEQIPNGQLAALITAPKDNSTVVVENVDTGGRDIGKWEEPKRSNE